MSKIQAYQELKDKEIKLLARVTTLGPNRYIITIAKEDNELIEALKSKRVIITVKEAIND